MQRQPPGNIAEGCLYHSVQGGDGSTLRRVGCRDPLPPGLCGQSSRLCLTGRLCLLELTLPNRLQQLVGKGEGAVLEQHLERNFPTPEQLHAEEVASEQSKSSSGLYLF